MFHEPPENVHDRDGRMVKKQDVGIKGFFSEKISGLERKGKMEAKEKAKKVYESKSLFSKLSRSGQKLFGKKDEGNNESGLTETTAVTRTQQRRLQRSLKKKES